MKNTLQHNKRGLLLAGMAALFVLGGATQSWAHGHDRGHDRGRDGGWDRHHRYHHYGYYHHHRGYWDERNGFRIWINI